MNCSLCTIIPDPECGDTVYKFNGKNVCHLCCAPPESFFWTDEDSTEEEVEEIIEEAINDGVIFKSQCGHVALESKYFKKLL